MLQTAILPFQQPLTLKKKLSFKIIFILILAVIIPLTLSMIFSGSDAVKKSLPLFLLALSIGSFLIWKLLKPLEEIYQGTLVLAKGELGHRFNLHTDDELELISNSLNTITQALSGTIQTISQDKDSLVSERNKLNTIIASITDGVIVLDLQRDVLLANAAAEKMLGLPIQTMAGKPVDQLISLKNSLGTLTTVQEYCQKPPASNAPLILTLSSRNGQETQVRFTVAQIVEGIQADLGCILIFHDISADKAFEQMQIDFVSMASHEFRTPLTSVIDYLSIIADEGKKKLGPELAGFVDRALISAQQMTALVDNILNVSKIERRSLSIDLQPLDWKKHLTDFVDNTKVLATQKRISLRLKLPTQTIPKVLVDQVRINEVLNNLISNAISYTKEGGKIEVGVKVELKEIVTYVADNGKGIPEEALPHLFGKFYRVTGALEEGNKGSGLGLYITKSIIDLHHGRVWVESKVGQGSTFYFSLPIADSAQAHPTIVELQPKAA
ncbi:MAG: ATP-binding protein [bacterium]|nr:ATP-binding protein [bacterium]